MKIVIDKTILTKGSVSVNDPGYRKTRSVVIDKSKKWDKINFVNQSKIEVQLVSKTFPLYINKLPLIPSPHTTLAESIASNESAFKLCLSIEGVRVKDILVLPPEENLDSNVDNFYSNIVDTCILGELLSVFFHISSLLVEYQQQAVPFPIIYII